MRRSAIVILAAALGYACDSNGSGDGSVGGLAGSKRLADLTEAETIDLCEGGREFASQDTILGTCAIEAELALVFSEPPSHDEELQLCQHVLDECRSRERTPEPCEPTHFIPSCQSTVADLKACLVVARDQLIMLAHRTCEEIIASRTSAAAGDAGDTSDGRAGFRQCNAKLDACFPSGDECCAESDNDLCGYADDGVCDCPDASWDASDCG